MGASRRFPSYYGAVKSLVTPEWHYVEGGKSGQELYACCDDEQQNLASAALGAALFSTFRQLLQEKNETLTAESLWSALRQHVLQGALKQRSGTLHADVANRQRMNEQLRALGYAH
jgi:hypothetical protein